MASSKTLKTLYILYNSDASIMGKLKYGYRKITCPSDAEPACAACDITHGGLSLKETLAWVKVKGEIESDSDLKVVQWHRDQMSSELRNYIKNEELRYPAVVLDRGDDEDFTTIMKSSELADCRGDPQAFVMQLRTKGVLQHPALK